MTYWQISILRKDLGNQPSRSLFWLRKFFAAGQEIISAIKEMFFHILSRFKREKNSFGEHLWHRQACEFYWMDLQNQRGTEISCLSKDYCKADSEQRVLFLHNNISAGHTSLLQVYRCYCVTELMWASQYYIDGECRNKDWLKGRSGSDVQHTTG